MEININNLNYTNAKEDSSPHTQVLSVPYSVCIVQYIVYSMQNISCKTWDTLTFFHFQIFLIVAKLFSFCYFHSEHLKCYTLYFWLPFFPSLVFALISTFLWDAYLLIYLLPSFFSSHLISPLLFPLLPFLYVPLSSHHILSYLISSFLSLLFPPMLTLLSRTLRVKSFLKKPTHNRTHGQTIMQIPSQRSKIQHKKRWINETLNSVEIWTFFFLFLFPFSSLFLLSLFSF